MTKKKRFYFLIFIILLTQVIIFVFLLKERDHDFEKRVTYQVNIDFIFTHDYNDSTPYYIRFGTFESRGTTSNLVEDKNHLYQEVELQKNELQGYVNIEINYDQYGNSYNLIKTNLTNKDKFILRQQYEITLKSFNFENRRKNYYNFKQPDPAYCDFSLYNYPELIKLSNKITERETTTIGKARAIHRWIVKNIEYDERYKGQGALQTSINKRGVCCDHSDLMMVLLRIQDIPARNAYGITLDDNTPDKGDHFTSETFFDGNSFEQNGELSVHAWVEYFVSGIGWIPCDPTWDYFNYIDCIHFFSNVEWGNSFLYPRIMNAKNSFAPGHYDYNLKIDFLVLESDYGHFIRFEYHYMVILAALFWSLVCVIKIIKFPKIKILLPHFKDPPRTLKIYLLIEDFNSPSRWKEKINPDQYWLQTIKKIYA